MGPIDLGESEDGMGGYGSGWRGSKKGIVEHCLVLPITALVRERVLVPGSLRRGTWFWKYEGAASPYSTIDYETDLREHASASIRLRYSTSGQQIDYRVPLTFTQPNYGGRRWWFLCPMLGIRVAKLYLPPPELYFASRQAHDLTYKSCRDSGKSDRLCRWLAAKLGKDEASVRESLRNETSVRKSLR